MEKNEYPNEVNVIHDFLSTDQCKQLILFGERLGFDEAAINTSTGQEIFKAIRNNERIIFDDASLAMELFEKIRYFVPHTMDSWKLHSLNERFRFYRYEPGQYFKWHRDGSFKRSEVEESRITFMIYLNDDFTGGDTEFREFKITPASGSALLFPHPLMHQGGTITEGVKYVLRTDVMYSR